jgi:hypothetical protein
MRLFGFSWSFMRLYEDPWDSMKLHETELHPKAS